MGKEDHVIKLDCSALSAEYFPLELGEYELLLINSNVHHNLASSEYNLRRAQCEDGVKIISKFHPEVNSLRDVTMDMLIKHKSKFPEVVFRRSKYVIDENQRLELFCEALLSKNFKEAGNLLYKAHEAMRTEYEITCDEIDFLVNSTKDNDRILGSRMMGGGFGGCTINFILNEEVDSYIDKIKKQYKGKFDKQITPIRVSVSDGVKQIS